MYRINEEIQPTHSNSDNGIAKFVLKVVGDVDVPFTKKDRLNIKNFPEEIDCDSQWTIFTSSDLKWSLQLSFLFVIPLTLSERYGDSNHHPMETLGSAFVRVNVGK